MSTTGDLESEAALSFNREPLSRISAVASLLTQLPCCISAETARGIAEFSESPKSALGL